MSEPRYTLDEAKVELRRRECFREGHSFSVVSLGVQFAGGGDEPLHIECGRCDERWPVGKKKPAKQGPVSADLREQLRTALTKPLPCPTCGSIRQCRCHVPPGAREQARLEALLAVAQPRIDHADQAIERAKQVATYWRDAAMRNNPGRDPVEAAVAHACSTILAAFDDPDVLTELGLIEKETG